MAKKKYTSLGLGVLFATTAIAGSTVLPEATAQGGSTVQVRSVGDRTGLDKYGAQPLSGVTFGLFKVSGKDDVPDRGARPVATAKSGGNGVAQFSGVASGNYYVQMIDAPQGYDPLEYYAVGDYKGEDMGTRSGYYVEVDGRSSYDLTKERKEGDIGSSEAYNWTSGIYPAIKENPRLTSDQCDPLDITVIADLSYSTKPQFDNGNYQKAMMNLIDSLAAKGESTLRIGTFAGAAPSDGLNALGVVQKQGPTTEAFDMADKDQVQAAKDRITKGYKGNAPMKYSEWQSSLVGSNEKNAYRQGTNWDHGLYQQVEDGFNSDIVLFFTDGMPTVDAPQAEEDTDRPSILRTKQRNLDYAVAAANAVKSMGSKVVAAYVDNDTDSLQNAPGTGRAYAANNLAAISGDREGVDYFMTDWTNIGKELANVPDVVCSPDEVIDAPGEDPETPQKREDTPVLQVSKEVSKKATKVGDMTTFEVKVKNASTKDTAKNVIVEDAAIKGLTDVKFTDTETGKAIDNIWQVGDLAPGQMRTATVQAKATGAHVDNSVSTHADNVPKKNVPADSIQRNNGNPDDDIDQHDRVDYQIATPPVVTEKKREKPVVKVAKQVNEQKNYKLGDTVNYTITVKNDSKTKAEEVKVEDYAQQGLSGLTLSNPTIGDASGTTWDVGILKPGQTATVQASAQITGTGTVDNQAHVSAKGLPTPGGDIQRNNDNVDDDTDQKDAVSINVDPETPPAVPQAAVTPGPKVNTGGEADAQSLWNKIKGLFA